MACDACMAEVLIAPPVMIMALLTGVPIPATVDLRHRLPLPQLVLLC
jgi:hypothetical protein